MDKKQQQKGNGQDRGQQQGRPSQNPSNPNKPQQQPQQKNPSNPSNPSNTSKW